MFCATAPLASPRRLTKVNENLLISPILKPPVVLVHHTHFPVDLEIVSNVSDLRAVKSLLFLMKELSYIVLWLQPLNQPSSSIRTHVWFLFSKTAGELCGFRWIFNEISAPQLSIIAETNRFLSRQSRHLYLCV